MSELEDLRTQMAALKAEVQGLRALLTYISFAVSTKGPHFTGLAGGEHSLMDRVKSLEDKVAVLDRRAHP